MKLKLICIGSPRPPLADAIAEYERRIGHYFSYEAVELPAGRGTPAAVRLSEAGAIRDRVPDGFRVFALTRTGKPMDSRALADRLDELRSFGPSGAPWLIGGAFGLDDALIEEADFRLSLSPLTLPHELARLVLVEQLYRAGTILRGEPYHKGGP